MSHFVYIDEYRDDENAIGAFPSFLNLINELKDHTKTYTDQHDSSMVYSIFNSFNRFLEDLGSYWADEILGQLVHFSVWVSSELSFWYNILQKDALRIVARFEASYLDKIQHVFKLDDLDTDEDEGILKEVLKVIQVSFTRLSI